jgi:hypothetical protein
MKQQAPIIQRENEDEKPGNGGSSAPQNDNAMPTKNIYLCGHGIHDFDNGWFKLPENTTVTFYTLHGKVMQNGDALRLLTGEHTDAPERVIVGGESCPNMTLLTENSQKEKETNARLPTVRCK